MPSDRDHTITLYLRNPQRYNLTVSQDSSDPVIIEDSYLSFSDSYSVLRLSLPKSFLQMYDEGTGAASIGHFSPLIYFIDKKTDRIFDVPRIPLHINTPPPEPYGALVMTDSTKDPQEYVVCFNLPAALDASTDWSVQNDLSTLFINDAVFNISTSGGTITFPDGTPSAIKTGDISTHTELQVSTYGTGLSFKSSGQSFYYYTGQAVSDTDYQYSIKLLDKAGLYSQAVTHVKTAKIAKPQLFDLTGTQIEESPSTPSVVEQGADLSAKVRIKIPSGCVDNDGNPNDISASGNRVEYKVWYTSGGQSSTPDATGSITADSLLELPLGKECKIQLVSKKSGYVESDTATFLVKPDFSQIFVAQGASDAAGFGTKARPYGTLQQALNFVTVSANDGGAAEGRGYTVNVSGTIRGNEVVKKPDGSDGKSFIGHIEYTDTTNNLKLTIQGTDGRRAVLDSGFADATEGGNNNSRALYISGPLGAGGYPTEDNNIDLTLKDLDIKGCRSTGNYINGAAFSATNMNSLTMQNVNVYKNYAGGANGCYLIYITGDSLSVKNCVIGDKDAVTKADKTNWSNYCANQILYLNVTDAVIEDTVVAYNYGIAIGHKSSGNLTLQGRTVIKNNSNNKGVSASVNTLTLKGAVELDNNNSIEGSSPYSGATSYFVIRVDESLSDDFTATIVLGGDASYWKNRTEPLIKPINDGDPLPAGVNTKFTLTLSGYHIDAEGKIAENQP